MEGLSETEAKAFSTKSNRKHSIITTTPDPQFFALFDETDEEIRVVSEK